MSTFTKRVGCAALSCRKVFLLAAVAALAFGAQANTYQYSLQFELKNIPAQTGGRPDHNLFFLVDKSKDGNNTVLMWLHRDELSKEVGDTWQLSEAGATHAAIKPTDPSYNAFDSYGDFAAHKLINATITKTGEGVRDRTIQVTFTTENDILTGDNVKWVDDEQGNSDYLWVIATNSKEPGQCDEYKVDTHITFAKTLKDGSGISLLAGAEYTNVPEPTSAMLLLLGVAGLALKRKVA